MLKKIIMKFSNVNTSILLMLVLVLAMFIHAQVDSQQEKHSAPYIENPGDPDEFLDYDVPEYFEHDEKHESWEKHVPEACQDKEKDGFELPADSSGKHLNSKGC